MEYGLVAQLGGRVVRKATQKSQLQAKNLSCQKSCKKQQKYGLVAQLGERSVRIRGVEGSNPFESTKKIQ